MIAPGDAMLATAVHGAGYLLVTALAAWVVFEKLSVTLLRQAWINVDLVWAAALIITGTIQLDFRNQGGSHRGA